LRADSDPTPEPRGPYTQIDVERIRPNPQQPRRAFADDELADLADSIVRHGLLHPVVVRESADGYELVVGERRWRAARLAGLTTIPAMVKDVASQEVLEMALVENVQRHDLNPIELALAFRALTEGGATQEQVGERVGLDRSTIANHLRLLELPRELQQEVETGVLSAGHAKALLQIDNPERRRHLRDRIVANQLSVRAAEELARSLTGTRTPTRRRSRAAGDAVDPHLQQLVDELRDQLQTKVRITSAAGRGKIEIEFYGPEDLHRITRAILEGPP
jgi:ParB family chromosome partitioning protein